MSSVSYTHLKTIVAFLAMIMTAENGYQSAIMVPTEVLARQHYEALTKLLEENELLEQYRPVLLTGSNTAKEKRQDVYKRQVRNRKEREKRSYDHLHLSGQRP